MGDNIYDQFDAKPSSAAPATRSPPVASSNIYDQFDKLPKPSPATPAISNHDWGSIGLAEPKARAYINSLPPEQQDQARQDWADNAVKHAYTSLPESVGDTIAGARRVAGSLPLPGSWLPKVAGAADYVTSGFQHGAYDMGRAFEDAQNRYLENRPSTKLLSTFLGDIYSSGLQKAGGVLVGAGALPWGKFTEGTISNAAINSGLYSGAEGLGEGQGDASDQLAHAGKRLATGTAAGAVVGAIAKPFTRAAPAVASNMPSTQEILEAAERRNVPVSAYQAKPDSFEQDAAGRLQGFPISGAPIRSAARESNAALTAAKDNIATDISSNAGTGAVAGVDNYPAAAREAGDALRSALLSWHRVFKKNELEKSFGEIRNLTDQTATFPLTNLEVMANKLRSDSLADATPLGKQLYNTVEEALDMHGGMTIEGMKRLRTYIRNLQDSGEVRLGGTKGPGLERLEDALSKDYVAAVKAGRLPGVAMPDITNKLNLANLQARQFGLITDQIFNLIGKDGEVPAERLVDKFYNMAGSKGGANSALLTTMQDTLSKTPEGQEAWNELGAALVRRLGQPKSGTEAFSPSVFTSEWKNISPRAKDLIYGPRGNNYRDAIEDISTISKPFHNIGKFTNPSGTAGALGAFEFFSMLGASLTSGNLFPVAASGAALAGSSATAAIVSRRVTAEPANRFMRLLSGFNVGKVGPTAVRAASTELSRAIASQFGVDPVRLNNNINQQFGLGPVAPQDHLNHIENSAVTTPEEKATARRQVLEHALAQ